MSRIAKTVLICGVLAALAGTAAAQGQGQGQRGGRGAGRPQLPAVQSLSDITWLTGNWRSAQGGLIIEERWTTPAGGAMLGVNRTLKGSQMVAFEFLRIVERDGKLVYIAQPNGRPPVEFTLSGMLENSATFENPMHDFPKIITYTWRDDGSLQAVVSDGGQNQETFEFNRAP